jgi:uncharacterized phage-associated protein
MGVTALRSWLERAVGLCAEVVRGTQRSRLRGHGTVQIEFPFNLEKALGAMVYLVDRLGSVDKVKLTKLMYIADRNHFIQHGHPITGSHQKAMDYGPVPSECLDALDGELWPNPDAALPYLHIDDNSVTARDKSVVQALEESERAALDQVLRSFGSADKWALVQHTHSFPEYQTVYAGCKRTSRLIPYELLLQLYGGENGFRHGRPVISEATLAHMVCPIPAGADADL